MILRMSLPKDVLDLRSAPDSPAAALGLRWCREGEVPPGYLDVPDLDPQVKKAWETMFRELTSLAEGPEGEWTALWRHGPGVAPERAPVVVLDTEGQLQCRAATALLPARTGEPEGLEDVLGMSVADGDVALHVESGDRGVSRITLMLRSSLPPDLR
jgi:hypothetical protein